MIRWIISLLKPRAPVYQFGVLETGTRARRNPRTGVVEFVLWKAGQQGHAEDYWHPCGSCHIFTPDGSTEGIETP